MSDTEQGRVVEVTIEYVGDVLIQDHLLGDTTLFCNDVSDFDEDGGQVWIPDSTTSGGTAYSYLSRNDDLDTILLATGLVQAIGVDTDVRLYPFAEEKRALVSTIEDEDGIRALIPFEMYDKFDDGIRDENVQESVLIRNDPALGWVVADASSQIPKTGGQYVDPVGLPGIKDNLPPATAPTIETRGGFQSVAVSFDPVPNADPVFYEYHVTLTNVAPTAGDPATLVYTGPETLKYLKTLADGVTALNVGTIYYFWAVAFDTDGYGPMSAGVGGTPGQVTNADIITDAIDARTIRAEQVKAEHLEAAMAFINFLSLGANITLFPQDSAPGVGDNGITVKSPSVGGQVRFPTDGSAVTSKKVIAEMDELLVNNNFNLNGLLNRIGGTLNLAIGVDTPVNGPSPVAITQDFPGAKGAAWDRSTALGVNQALCDAGTMWASVEVGASGAGRVVGYDKTTGAMSVLVPAIAGGSWYPLDLTRDAAGNFYVMYMDLTSGVTVANRYKIRKYDSSWAYQSAGSWTIPVNSASTGPDAICVDQTTGLMYIGWWRNNTDYKSTVLSYPITGGAGTTVLVCADSNSGTNHDVSHFWVGTSFYGTQKFFIRISGGGVNVYAPGTSSPDTTRSFPTSTSGFYSDGTDMWGLFPGTPYRAFKFNKALKVGQSVRVKWSKFDSDPAGTGGQHETAMSTNYTQYAQPALTYFSVSTPAPGDNGNNNDPDTIRHYIQTALAGNYWRQPDVSAAPWVAYYDVPLTSGSSSVYPTDFTGVGNPGNIRSSALYALLGATARMIQLNGDGSGNVGSVGWDADGGLVNEATTSAAGANGTTVSTSSGTFLRHSALACETTFVAPLTGNVMVEVVAYIIEPTTLVLICPEVRAGSAIGSGTLVYTAGNTDAVGGQFAAATPDSIIRVKSFCMVRGLTPGATYNTYMAVYRTAAGIDINNSAIRVTPMR